MFDLEQHIAAWRAAMESSLGGQSDAIDELESHLREQLHRLALEGHAADEAWRRAVERLGPPRQLADEFRKNRSPAPLGWLAAWTVLFVYVVAGVAGLALLLPAIARRGDGLLGLHVLTVTMGYGAVLAFGALAIWSFLGRAVRGADADLPARLQWWALRFSWAGLALTAIGVVTGAVWANENWGRFWNWDAKEMGGAAVVLWSLIAVWQLWRPNRGGVTGWVLGLTGNIVVWCAWLGAAWLSDGLHSYPGISGLGALVVGFVGVHVVLLALVLATARTAPRAPAAL